MYVKLPVAGDKASQLVRDTRKRLKTCDRIPIQYIIYIYTVFYVIKKTKLENAVVLAVRPNSDLNFDRNVGRSKKTSTVKIQLGTLKTA